VSRPLLLDTKVKTPKSTRKAKKGRARARKPVVDTESEESEESGSGDSSDDDGPIDPGKPCRLLRSNGQRGRVCPTRTKCPFFKKNKVCQFYHADAPIGTTGHRRQLNKASVKKLTSLGVFKRGR
jgi:hypothetical protein